MSPDPWITLTSNEMFQRSEFACDVYKDRYILVAGGSSENLEDMESGGVFDVRTDVQAALPSLPDIKNKVCHGCVMGDYFYVVLFNWSIYRLELTKDFTWESIPPLGGVKQGHVDSVISDGRHLFFFGFDESIIYDPKTNSSIRLPPKPTPAAKSSYAVVGDDIYVIGGIEIKKEVVGECFTTYGGCLSIVEVYNTTTNSWRQEPSLPKSLARAGATVFGRWIVVTGGVNSFYFDNYPSYVYDTLTRRWAEREEGCLLAREGHSCVPIDGRYLISVGGRKEINQCAIKAIRRNLIIPNWNVIEHFFLVRKLVELGRAHPIDPLAIAKNVKDRREIEAIHMLMINLLSDMFKEVLSYLI